jgi:hypothetical protein
VLAIPRGDVRRDLARGDLRGETRDRSLLVGQEELDALGDVHA